jgi:NitT/TauT family transport system permease protein
MNRAGRRLAAAAPAVAVFVGVLVVLEVALRAGQVQSFVLPRPSRVVTAMGEEWSSLVSASLATFSGALGGLLLGSTLAVVAALASARWVAVRRGALPLAVALNSMPIIVLAPVANAWFGLLSPFGTVFVVSILVFFPVMINTLRGLLSATASQHELMASYASSRRSDLWRLQSPTALPFFFSALKIAAPLSMIGAIVKEYFGGPQDRLGQYITTKAALFQFPDAWAAIVLASCFGIALYVGVVLLERRLMPWHVSVRVPA